MVASKVIEVGDNHQDSSCIIVEGGASHAQSDEEDILETASMETFTHPSTCQTPLEERVQELEEKLARLTLLLYQQQKHQQQNPSIVSPLTVTPPESPPPPPPTSASARKRVSCSSRHMPLESPTPERRPTAERHKRNLSYRVLHDDLYPPREVDEDNLLSPTSDRLDEILSETESPMQVSNTDENNMSRVPSAKQLLFSQLGNSLSVPAIVPNDSNSVSQNAVPSFSVPQKATITPTKQASSKDASISNTPLSKAEAIASLSAEPEKGDNVKSKWLDYLNSYQESDYDTDKQMEEFLKVPKAVEALMNFGFWICVDSFLYTVTILPIRSIWSCLLLARFLVLRLFDKTVPEGPYRFHRRHSYQLIQVSIIYIIHDYVLKPVKIGWLYHWIRSQAMVKLYLLIAIVEVFDRLMCSLGQDCLDSLYWNTTRRPRSIRLLVSVMVGLAYAAVHSLLLFVHVATLNVAINSEDQALISLLIGGNFAEIKSTVFKKYNKANLFKICASDICERFKLALFLALVLTLNMSQGMDERMVKHYVQMCGVVWVAEWLSDWIKHAFITKFNFISSQIYPEYALLLAGDATGIGHEGVNLDHTHAVVKRIGLAQLPLVCVMVRYLTEAHKYATYELQLSRWFTGLSVVFVWFLLVLCKLFLGSFLQRMSLEKLQQAPEFSNKNAKLEKKHV